MYGHESIVLQRDVHVVQIPDGTPGTLPQGHVVTLYQELGGNFTVTTEQGYMVRIAAADGDALGKEPASIGALNGGTDEAAIEENAWAILRTIYDPEIPVNIADLGLIYSCRVVPLDPGAYRVEIIMTLTAPGCGMGPVLQQDIETAIKALPGVAAVTVDVIFDPPWSRDMMSEVAKLQLGMF
jgi:probable FeS assembly SUF system protein SufT